MGLYQLGSLFPHFPSSNIQYFYANISMRLSTPPNYAWATWTSISWAGYYSEKGVQCMERINHTWTQLQDMRTMGKEEGHGVLGEEKRARPPHCSSIYRRHLEVGRSEDDHSCRPIDVKEASHKVCRRQPNSLTSGAWAIERHTWTWGAKAVQQCHIRRHRGTNISGGRSMRKRE